MAISDGTARNRGVSEIMLRILRRRGIEGEDAQRFLFPDYGRDLHDPFLMLDMEKAVKRIELARERAEQVVVYGDYDIDGITATAVLLEGLVANGIRATSYIPDRFEEGYGINQLALEAIQRQGVSLVISVDCGITSAAEAAWAKEHGLDLVITDHHSVPAVLPDAVAVINPKREGDPYPFKELAGVGVAFKLVLAMQRRFGKPQVGQEKWLLDLVALGTVCDVVPLIGENRALAYFGLKVARKTRRVGLRELAHVGGVQLDALSARDFGFVLGPRMNAAGRLEHANTSLELVTTASVERAVTLATELDQLNQRRRAQQDEIFEAADKLAVEQFDDAVLVLSGEDWSHGVVGIVASKLVDKWHKPVLVAERMGDSTKGSARSIPGFNMVEALRSQSEILAKFGGHYFAAGFTLPTDNFEALRAGLNYYYSENGGGEQNVPEIECDEELTSLAEARLELLGELELLEPFGSGNPEPIFDIREMTLVSRQLVGANRRHLKFEVSDSAGNLMGGIAFGLGSVHDSLIPGNRVRTKARLNKNDFRGRVSVQLMAEQITSE